METGASTGRGGGGSRGRRDDSAVLHNAGGGSHAGGAPADAALDLLCADPAVLDVVGEPGLVVLDAQLSLDATTRVDVLACDRDGAPVLALFCDDEGAVLLRIARVLGAFRRGGGLLRAAFGERGLDPTRTPRLLLLAPRFSDELPEQLDLLGQAQVAALEYRVVRPRGGEAVLDVVLLHRAGSTPSGRPASAGGGPVGHGVPPRGRELPHRQAVSPSVEPDELTALELEPLSAEDLDGLLDRAYQSVVSLSEQVSATDEGERIRFLVDGRPLASLLRDEAAGSLTLTLDEEGGTLETLTIADEVGLHAALNALFERYFRELDVPL